MNRQPPPAGPTHLWLVRHAEVEVRYQKVFGGKIDMDLSPRGHEQAAALAGWLGRQHLDAIYASPMKRVHQTLAALAGNGAPKPTLVPDFREVDFGDWTGLGWTEVFAKFQVRATEWLDHLDAATVPNGETGAAFRARVEPDLRRVVAAHPGRHVAVVAHGGVIRMVLAILLDLPLPKTAAFEIDYASVTHLEIDALRTEVQLLNFAPWRDLRP